MSATTRASVRRLAVGMACALASLAAVPDAFAAAGELRPLLLDNRVQETGTAPGTCPSGSHSDLRETDAYELRRIADLGPELRAAGAAADGNGDGSICVGTGALVDLWPKYVDDTIVFPSWHPIYLTCPNGYFLKFLGAFFDPADPLEAYDDNHDRWICRRIFA